MDWGRGGGGQEDGLGEGVGGKGLEDDGGGEGLGPGSGY